MVPAAPIVRPKSRVRSLLFSATTALVLASPHVTGLAANTGYSVTETASGQSLVVAVSSGGTLMTDQGGVLAR